ncbi:hypothetical protein niasHT_009060 [Heterodera trifolii]|uniref:Uncharacterized protein n=1 Tax=Heterodera trifolii TaxID=157864 RepID=A0ABD2MBV2_9BILA
MTFQFLGLNPPAFQSLGLKSPAFQSLGLNTSEHTMPGLNPPAFQSPGLNSPAFQSPGLNLSKFHQHFSLFVCLGMLNRLGGLGHFAASSLPHPRLLPTAGANIIHE